MAVLYAALRLGTRGPLRPWSPSKLGCWPEAQQASWDPAMWLWERVLPLSSELLFWAGPGLQGGGGAPGPQLPPPPPPVALRGAVIHHRRSQTHLGGSDDLFCTCSVKGFHFSSNCNFYLFQGDLLTRRPARAWLPAPSLCLRAHSPAA